MPASRDGGHSAIAALHPLIPPDYTRERSRDNRVLVHHGVTLDQLNDDSHAYLFPEWDTYDELEDLLVEVYDEELRRRSSGSHARAKRAQHPE